MLEKGIRVNCVAPGPVWTPLIVSSYSAEESAQFGADVSFKNDILSDKRMKKIET